MMIQLFKLLAAKKKLFLLPLILVLVAAGVLIVFASNSIIAPFIYTFF